MLRAAQEGRLLALLAVGTSSGDDLGVELVEGAAAVADALTFFLERNPQEGYFSAGPRPWSQVLLPAASAYEKSGTFTNTCGDVQLLKKAGDIAGVKSEFEILVRLADRMSTEVRKLVPFGAGVHADMGQSRGAQSGEADRHSIWLAANNLEPRLSPFDPMAILDEIQRLVPGYDFSRLGLVAGNDQHVMSAERSSAGPGNGLVQIMPAQDNLFTSGALGSYSRILNSVIENRGAQPVDTEVMAD